MTGTKHDRRASHCSAALPWPYGLGARGLATCARADRYPNRPVKIIVPTVAGGTVDVITRLVANDLSSRLGASFFVDNRSGAGNTLGSREAARAEADGYTLLMSSASGQVIQSARVPQRRLRCGQELCADRPGRRGLHHSGDQSVAAVQIRPRAGGLRQGQSGQAQLRVGRNRHLAAPGRRIVQVGGRRRSRARPLSRRCAVDRRRDRRQRSTDVRGGEPAARAHP